MPKFKNIAEFVIKMAQAPNLIRFNLTFDELKDSYVQQVEPAVVRQMDSYIRRYEGFTARFSII